MKAVLIEYPNDIGILYSHS